MHFRNLALAIFCSVLEFTTFAQSALLEWGPETELKLEETRFMACSDDNTCYIVDMVSPYAIYFYITKISNLSPHGEKREVNLPKIGDQTVNFKDILMIDGQLALLTYLTDDKQKTRTLYAYNFNSDLDLSKEARIVSVVKNVGKKDYGYSKHFLTDDKKNLCIVRRTPGDSASIGFTCSDKAHTILFDFDVTLPGTKYGSIETFTILPDGNLYFAAKIEKLKAERSKGLPAYYYMLYKYDPLTKNKTQTKLDLDSNYILGVRFALDGSGNFICGGSYSLHEPHERKNANEFLNGFFALVCSKSDGHIVSKEQKSIGNDNVRPSVLTLNFWDYKLEHVIPLSDGGIMFLSEQQGVFASGGAFYESGNGIIVAMMNPKTHSFGHFEINKQQGKGSKDYTYLLFSQNNKVDIILNAEEELLEKTKARGNPVYLDYDSKSVIFYQISIDNKSNVGTNRIKTTNVGSGYNLVRSLYTKVNNNTYVISARTEKGNYRFAKLTLK